MRRIAEIFTLEWRALIRQGVLPLLWLFSLVWTLAAPFWLQSDGTELGAREVFLTYGVGVVFTLSLIAFGASAAGSLAQERAAKRLQLSLVRPASAFSLAWGRFLAHTVACATVIALSLLVAAFVCNRNHTAYHVRYPLLQTPAAEAEEAYAAYMKSPETPEAVKKMKKAAVLRILEQKAFDRYETIPTNTLASWQFAAPKGWSSGARMARFKFASLYDTRGEVRGLVSLGTESVAVSNVTKSVLFASFSPTNATETAALAFHNKGRTTLMLRPRRDVQLMDEAGTFFGNLVRAGVVLIALAALVIAFATFLGAGLGRAVAVFTLLGFLFVSLVGPDVIENYPDPLESNRLDSLGLTLTRTVDRVTKPFSRPSPIKALIADEYVENDELTEALVVNIILVPLAFAAFAALCLRRKEEGL